MASDNLEHLGTKTIKMALHTWKPLYRDCQNGSVHLEASAQRLSKWLGTPGNICTKTVKMALYTWKHRHRMKLSKWLCTPGSLCTETVKMALHTWKPLYRDCQNGSAHLEASVQRLSKWPLHTWKHLHKQRLSKWLCTPGSICTETVKMALHTWKHLHKQRLSKWLCTPGKPLYRDCQNGL